ncbi:hypothetical protein A3F66_05855 [candidate division TM6 bacterium RIFCSPHIGHO2_12_FULL_32_22]|nr:MAG: hypothetical protein A3F66_05855 [candidate division TM6 bacterium RIFCSPHIGHO2_12_FULL_32_22]
MKKFILSLLIAVSAKGAEKLQHKQLITLFSEIYYQQQLTDDHVNRFVPYVYLKVLDSHPYEIVPETDVFNGYVESLPGTCCIAGCESQRIKNFRENFRLLKEKARKLSEQRISAAERGAKSAIQSDNDSDLKTNLDWENCKGITAIKCHLVDLAIQNLSLKCLRLLINEVSAYSKKIRCRLDFVYDSAHYDLADNKKITKSDKPKVEAIIKMLGLKLDCVFHDKKNILTHALSNRNFAFSEILLEIEPQLAQIKDGYNKDAFGYAETDLAIRKFMIQQKLIAQPTVPATPDQPTAQTQPSAASVDLSVTYSYPEQDELFEEVSGPPQY